MELELPRGEAEFTREVKLEAVRRIGERGVSYTPASADLGMDQLRLREWVKNFSDDHMAACIPTQGQMNPAQQEIVRLSSAK